ncbi:MAG: hypothetical protein ACREIM_11505 [Nitrospiraceae bacterium]
MNIKTHGEGGDGGNRVIGWLAGSVGGLLLFSLGLELLAHQIFGQTDVATLLLALYLAFWSSVLGIVGFLVLSIKWLVEGRRLRMDRAADLEDHQYPRPGVTPVNPSRLSRESNDTNRSRHFNRVA